jgi:hypothetical protein
VYAGILIRGIRNIDNSERFNRVTKITEEVFRRMGNIVLHVGQVHLRPIKQDDQIKVETPFKTRRVGLTRKENDEKGYINERYRYIVELMADHKFQGKEAVDKEMLKSGRLTRERIKDVLGYNLGQ